MLGPLTGSANALMLFPTEYPVKNNSGNTTISESSAEAFLIPDAIKSKLCFLSPNLGFSCAIVILIFLNEIPPILTC